MVYGEECKLGDSSLLNFSPVSCHAVFGAKFSNTLSLRFALSVRGQVSLSCRRNRFIVLLAVELFLWFVKGRTLSQSFGPMKKDVGLTIVFIMWVICITDSSLAWNAPLTAQLGKLVVMGSVVLLQFRLIRNA